MEVLKDNKDMFGVNFDENKEALNKISTITSKILKNELAGYITKFIKNELRNEKEKTESAENEEQISEDTEPTEETAPTEPTEETAPTEPTEETAPTEDKSKDEPVVEETPAEKKVSEQDLEYFKKQKAGKIVQHKDRDRPHGKKEYVVGGAEKDEHVVEEAPAEEVQD